MLKKITVKKKILLYSCFILGIQSCYSQNNNRIQNKKFTTSWNQYLGNTKTAYYKDQFILSNDLEITAITTENGGLPSPLIVFDNIVYFGTAQSAIVNNPISYVFAFKENKTLKWKKEIKGNVVHSMAVSKGVLIVLPTNSDYVYGFNTKNGDILWKTKNPFPQKIESIAPIIDNNLVYINAVFILDIKTGLPINDNYSEWHPWSKFTHPEFKDSTVFTSYTLLNKGGVVALEKDTGKQKWDITGNDNFINKTFTHKDTLYAGERFLGGCKIPLNNPEILDEYFHDIKTRKKYGIKIGNIYYFTSHGSYSSEVIAVNLDTKETIWKHDFKSDSVTEPIIIGDYIYFGTKDGDLYVLNRITGKIKMKEYFNGSIIGRLAYSNGKLYVGVKGRRFTDDFTIYLIKNK